jgi:hypothetical protein
MSVGIGENDAAAFFCKVYCVVIAALIFRNILLDDEVLLVDAESLDRCSTSVNVRCVVTGVLILNADQTDLDVRASSFLSVSGGDDRIICCCRAACRGTAACSKAECHHC